MTITTIANRNLASQLFGHRWGYIAISHCLSDDFLKEIVQNILFRASKIWKKERELQFLPQKDRWRKVTFFFSKSIKGYFLGFFEKVLACAPVCGWAGDVSGSAEFEAAVPRGWELSGRWKPSSSRHDQEERTSSCHNKR